MTSQSNTPKNTDQDRPDEETTPKVTAECLAEAIAVLQPTVTIDYNHCAGCMRRFTGRARSGVVGFYISYDGSVRGVYRLCKSCDTKRQKGVPGLLERIEANLEAEQLLNEQAGRSRRGRA